MVICLDVSGSMDGLIDSAKNKLWDIVNELARILRLRPRRDQKPTNFCKSRQLQLLAA